MANHLHPLVITISCGETTMNEHMAYVAYCKCGKLIFACVDDPEHAKDTAKEVSKIIKDGFAIHRISCKAVREGPRCKNHGNCE